MQKHGFSYLAILLCTTLLCGCSSYSHQQAANDFFEGASNNAETNQNAAEQQDRNADSSLLPDVLAGAGTVFLRWLTDSDDTSN